MLKNAFFFITLLYSFSAPAGTCYSDDQVVVIGDSTAYGMVNFAMEKQFRGNRSSIPSGWKSFSYPSFTRHPVYGGASSKYVSQKAAFFDFRFAKNAIISVGYNDLSIDANKDGKETIKSILKIVELLRSHEVPRIKIIVPFTSSKRQTNKKFINETKLLTSIRKSLDKLVGKNSDVVIIYHDGDKDRDGLHLTVKGYKTLYKRATEC